MPACQYEKSWDRVHDDGIAGKLRQCGALMAGQVHLYCIVPVLDVMDLGKRSCTAPCCMYPFFMGITAVKILWPLQIPSGQETLF
ncbi:hypothetical protein UVI_02017150 [Ustilaginoidea virens]|uniref:Uncharacterized protein n=1 Tax=Ustilaginoidea virens TaxID=1159556 RepID=A0A1B5L1R3_USTVR|nr:hypothetical protein UVI_02017150 [Ustilaginoidea virens]